MLFVTLPLFTCFFISFSVENKSTIVKAGALPSLIIMLVKDDTEVQCNSCGCITTLATTEENKRAIVKHGAIPPLLKLTHVADSRVQRNAAGALLNLTHIGMVQWSLTIVVTLGTTKSDCLL